MRSLVVLGVLISLFVVVGASAQSSREFVLRVDRQGSFFVAGAGAAALNESSVTEQARASLDRDAGVALVVQADPSAPYESVRRAAELLAQAGAARVWFRTSRADQP